MAAAEPERELINRATPFAIALIPAAFLLGSLFGGWPVGLSAALGLAVVFGNFVVHGLSLIWAGRISLAAVFATGLGGFILRLAAIFILMLALTQLGWFSPKAFVAAAVPGTIALLAFEMKQLSGKIQADLWVFKEGQ